MARSKLTDRAIKAARTEARQEDLRDTQVVGLVLRVYNSGRKTWGVLYTTKAGRRRWYKLGVYDAVGLEEARDRARSIVGRVADGEDPQAERERERRGGDVATVEDLAEQYLERYVRRHKAERSIHDDEAQLRRYVLPRWGKRRPEDIARRDVKRLLEDLADGTLALRGKPTTTAPRALRAVLSKMFAWAVEEEILPANPAARVPLPTKPTSRDRVLDEQEVVTVWRELDRMEAEAPVTAAAFRLLLLTAARPGEVLGMRWDEIAGEWWTIPAERVKNRQSHRVPLSREALAVLDRVRPITGSSPYVLDSPAKPGQPLSTLKTANHGIIRRCGMPRWVPHDLRRTAATHLTSNGTPRLVVERLLNHSERGVAAVYDRSSYDRDKRRALVWWGRKVKALASEGAPARVVAMGAR